MNYAAFSDGISVGEFEEFEPVDTLAEAHMPIHGVIRINFHVLRQRAFNVAYGMKVPSACMAELQHQQRHCHL